MKRLFAATALIVLAGAATAQARMDVSVNIGVPVAVAPPPAAVVTYPAYAPAPVYEPQPVYAEAPQFIFAPQLGFYVSVGMPYDTVYLDNCYYQYRGGYWYMAPSYRGPWSFVAQHRLPYGLHKHRYEQIRYYRDREYRVYQHDRDHYRGTWYRPAAVRDHDGRGRDRDHNRDRDDRRDDRRNDRRDHR